MQSVEDLYMHKPCPKCPFRKNDGILCLGKERAKQILHGNKDEGFVCHETTGVLHNNPSHRRQCAGAMILSLKTKKPNIFVTTYVTMFGKQPDLRGAAEIVDSEEEFITLQT